MLERTLFDQHINAIKQKYQRITQQHHTTTQPKQTNADEQFITPVRPNKHNITQTKNIESPATNVYQSVRQRSHSKQNLKGDNNEQKNCLTARNRTAKTDEIQLFISEKQAILEQRMQQNERKLMKSKQLRDRESRNSSVNKPTKQPEKTKKQTSSNQENYYSHSLTQRKTKLTTNEGLPVSSKLKLEEANGRARKMFAQKINQVIDESLQNRELCMFNEKKEQTIKEKPPSNLISFTKTETENLQQKKLKLVTVFDNTSKIQERIKALLSSH